MTFAERADAFVNAIGLGENLMRPFKPRRLKWTSTIVVVLLHVGLVLHLIETMWFESNWSAMLIFFVQNIAYLLQVFGPLRVPTFEQPLDERERDLHARAYHYASEYVAWVSICGCAAFGFAGELAPSSHILSGFTHVIFWGGIAMFLIGARHAIPSLYIGWMVTPLPLESET